MHRLFITLAAAASYASAQTNPASSSAAASPSLIGAVVPVGQPCTPGGTPCALGADCYATNSMLQTICGNFQASCTSDQQCAFNACNQGFCNGALFSSSSSAPASVSTPPPSTPTATTSSLPTAPAGSLPLGAQCDPLVTPSQCAGGAQCWASNSMLIAACGNFNAACTSDAQCAFNTCNNGLCNGLKPSSPGGGNGTATATVGPTGGGQGSATRTPTGAGTGGTSPPIYTGAAAVSRMSEMGGLVAALLAVVARGL